MDRRRGEGIWREEQEKKDKSKITLNKWKCIVCGNEIPFGKSFFDNGVHCKECWDKKIQSRPWSNKRDNV